MLPAKAVLKFADTLIREILISTENTKGRAEMAVIFSSLAGPLHLGASLRTATSISEIAPWVTEPQNIFF